MPLIELLFTQAYGTLPTSHWPKHGHMTKQGRGVNCSYRKTTSHVAMGGSVHFFYREGGSKYLGTIIQSTMEYVLMSMVYKILIWLCP